MRQQTQKGIWRLAAMALPALPPHLVRRPALAQPLDRRAAKSLSSRVIAWGCRPSFRRPADCALVPTSAVFTAEADGTLGNGARGRSDPGHWIRSLGARPTDFGRSAGKMISAPIIDSTRVFRTTEMDCR